VDLPKTKMTLVAGVAAAGMLTAALVTVVVWPSLVRPEPPLEKAGDDGLRIRLVEPPKAATRSSSPLDVGLSEAAQAMAKGREALLVRTPSPPVRPRAAPVRIAQADETDEVSAPPEPEEVSWPGQAERRDGLEEARRRRWEEERLAREARDERAAWEQEAIDRRRLEDAREQDRYDNRYPSPPEEDRGPRRERW
jgi:hypothetical protein